MLHADKLACSNTSDYRTNELYIGPSGNELSH